MPPIVWGLVILALVGATFWIAVKGQHSKSIDWGLFGLIGTAFGTTLLAIATASQALITRREVSATRDLAEVAMKDRRSQHEALLKFGQPVWSGLWQGAHIATTVTNAGLGPALDVTFTASYVPAESGPPPVIEPQHYPTIAAGESIEVQLRVSFAAEPPAGVQTERFMFEVEYTDRLRTNGRLRSKLA